MITKNDVLLDNIYFFKAIKDSIDRSKLKLQFHIEKHPYYYVKITLQIDDIIASWETPENTLRNLKDDHDEIGKMIASNLVETLSRRYFLK